MQLRILPLPAGDEDPVGHALSDDEPDVQYVPVPHGVQVCPVWYFPAAHGVHDPPLSLLPIEPALQTQLAMDVEPTGDPEFEGHISQAADPAVACQRVGISSLIRYDTSKKCCKKKAMLTSELLMISVVSKLYTIHTSTFIIRIFDVIPI